MQRIANKLIYVALGVLLGIALERFALSPQRHTPQKYPPQKHPPEKYARDNYTTNVAQNTRGNAPAASQLFETSQASATDGAGQLSAGQAARLQFLAQLRQLLNDHLWDEAVSLYEEYLRNHEDEQQTLKKLFVEFSQRLRGDKDFDSALLLSQSYLTYDYRDADFLIESALIYESQNLWQKSLETYQIGLTYADDARDRKKLQDSLLDFVARRDTVSAESSLVELYENLIEFNLDDVYLNGIYFRLAQLYFKLGEQSRAIESLSMLDPDSEWAAKSQQMLDEFLPPSESPASAGSETISLLRLGEHYVVDVTIGGRQNARLLIDTGASMSVLAQRYFQTVESDLDSIRMGSRRFSTAGGRVRAPYYLLSSLELNAQSVADVGVAIMDIELPPNVDGLLGMNVLKHFSFQIDQERRELVLQPRH